MKKGIPVTLLVVTLMFTMVGYAQLSTPDMIIRDAEGSSSPIILPPNPADEIELGYETEMVTGVGAGGTPFYVAIKFTEATLEGFADEYSFIRFIVGIWQPADEIELTIWAVEPDTEPEPADIVYTQVVDEGLDVETWNPIVMDDPVLIEEGYDYWIGYWIEYPGGFPAGAGAGDADNPGHTPGLGQWVSFDGEDWGELSGFEIFRDWSLRVVIDVVTSVPELDIPETLTLHNNYPNPFNPSTVIEFGLPNDSHVLLTVYDILGREVATLVDRELHAGAHSVTFEASSLTSGVYFYRLQAGDEVRTHRMILQK